MHVGTIWVKGVLVEAVGGAAWDDKGGGDGGEGAEE